MNFRLPACLLGDGCVVQSREQCTVVGPLTRMRVQDAVDTGREEGRTGRGRCLIYEPRDDMQRIAQPSVVYRSTKVELISGNRSVSCVSLG